uniref:Uncharacterized protein n=1 Tax=Quercus lobata TaxID=97700 RepID=A0A7N2LFD6_QUELO
MGHGCLSPQTASSVAHVVRDRLAQSLETFVPHHHTVPPTIHLLEAIVDERGERISNRDPGDVQPKRVAKATEMKHPLTDKEILGNLKLFDAHLQDIDKELAKTSHTETLAENNVKMDSSFQFRATMVEYEKEGQVDKVDLDHGAHKDNGNIGEGGSVRKDEENIIVDSNKSTLPQKGKWKRIGLPLKQRDTMEIEVELQHQKRKSDNIEGSDGEKKQSDGQSGDLALLWKPESKVEVKGLSRWYIDACIDYDNRGEIWWLTGFYGHPDTNRREETCNQPHGRGKVFRFEVMWLRDPQCDVVVEETWQEGLYKTGGSPFVNYMESYRDRLGILE